MSPRIITSLSHGMMRNRFKGYLTPYTILLTQIRSPSVKVGFIEPDGIWNGSVIGQRISKASNRAIPRLLSHSKALSRVRPRTRHARTASIAFSSPTGFSRPSTIRWARPFCASALKRPTLPPNPSAICPAARRCRSACPSLTGRYPIRRSDRTGSGCCRRR